MKTTSALQRTILAGSIAAFTAVTAHAQYSVTVLHNNDAESKLINLGSGGAANYGGIARFKSLVDETRSFYQGLNHGVVTISAGDNFLAGAIFQASLDSGAPGSRTFYDALGMSLINYDAVTIGNHEFDFGPQVLAEFIGDAQTTNATKFLSANLDFSANTDLQAHVTAGRLAPSTIINVNTSAGVKKVGIIGATTETLPYVSTPGNVVVNSVATAVNTQIASLQGQGAHIIVLSSHLQGLTNEQALVPLLNPGINLIIAGGGDELLANIANPSPITTHGLTAPGSVTDTGFVPLSGYNNPTQAPNQALYPIISGLQDIGGNNIPIVTGRDNYSYLGRITLNVDAGGNVTVDPSSNPQRVASTTVDAVHGVAADPTVQANVVTPVSNFVATLAATNLGTTSVELNRSEVRFRETNLGNLVADAFLDKAQSLAAGFSVDVPQVSFVNGGGIRQVINTGTITRLETFDVSPFGNLLAVVEDVTSADFKMLLENAYSKTTDSPAPGITPAGTDGRFAQISGFTVVYDISAQPLVLSPTGAVITMGSRILEVTLANGTPVIVNGVPVPGFTLDVATANFLTTGGDQYFDADYLSQDYLSKTTILGGVSDQQLLQSYIEGFTNNDIGLDSRYDLVSDGRITAVPEPGSIVSLVGGAVMLLGLRRRRDSRA